jgi:hypothetical protein
MTDPHFGRDPLFEAVQDVNASYRAARTGYTRPDEYIDDTITPTNVRPHVIRALTGFLLASVVGFFLACCMGCLTLSGNATLDEAFQTSGSQAFGSSFLTFWAILGLSYIAWIVSLFFRIREPIAEYSLLIEGRAMAAPNAYGFVLRAAQARSTPFPLYPIRLAGQYMLRLGDDRLQSLIVVQTYGTDLYVGWTMWRSRSTMVVLWHIIRDLFRIFAGGTAYRSALQNTHARALREITHSLTRLGVQAAVLNVTAPPEVLHLVAQVAEVSVDQRGASAPPPIQQPTQTIPTDPSGQQYYGGGVAPASGPPGQYGQPPVSGPPGPQYPPYNPQGPFGPPPTQ